MLESKRKRKNCPWSYHSDLTADVGRGQRLRLHRVSTSCVVVDGELCPPCPMLKNNRLRFKG